MSKEAQHLYEFGPFRLETAERTLLHDGHPVSLPPKVFDTLVILVQRSGHVVEKDELMQKLWPDTFVEESNLTQNVFTLRRVLGEGHDEHPYIVTVPKRGYRFVADVRELEVEPTDLIIEKHTRAHVITEEEEADFVLPSRALPLDTLNICPNNLPGQLTSLIGRKAELAEIESLLQQSDLRLLTLTGAGGSGKTRLGLQVAADLLQDFADGVFFVPLAPTSALCTLANISYDQGHYKRALSFFKESLTIRGEIGDKHGITECLEGLARVAIAENQFERAIQLFEGAATQREVLNIQPSASGQEQSDRNKALARGMLEDEAFASACEQGRAMTLEQAIAFALM